MGHSSQISVKALALNVLAASRTVPTAKPPGTSLGTVTDFGITPSQSAVKCDARAGSQLTPEPECEVRQPVQRASCGSPRCAGCYEVEPGVRIHPPKCGENYCVWLEQWEAKGKVQ